MHFFAPVWPAEPFGGRVACLRVVAFLTLFTSLFAILQAFIPLASKRCGIYEEPIVTPGAEANLIIDPAVVGQAYIHKEIKTHNALTALVILERTAVRGHAFLSTIVKAD